jgi:hypothetical protein
MKVKPTEKFIRRLLLEAEEQQKRQVNVSDIFIKIIKKYYAKGVAEGSNYNVPSFADLRLQQLIAFNTDKSLNSPVVVKGEVRAYPRPSMTNPEMKERIESRTSIIEESEWQQTVGEFKELAALGGGVAYGEGTSNLAKTLEGNLQIAEMDGGDKEILLTELENLKSKAKNDGQKKLIDEIKKQVDGLANSVAIVGFAKGIIDKVGLEKLKYWLAMAPANSKKYGQQYFAIVTQPLTLINVSAVEDNGIATKLLNNFFEKINFIENLESNPEQGLALFLGDELAKVVVNSSELEGSETGTESPKLEVGGSQSNLGPVANAKKILGLDPDKDYTKADEAEVKKAYQTAAFKFSPDNKETGDAAKFREVTAARDLFKNMGVLTESYKVNVTRLQKLAGILKD